MLGAGLTTVGGCIPPQGAPFALGHPARLMATRPPLAYKKHPFTPVLGPGAFLYFKSYTHTKQANLIARHSRYVRNYRLESSHPQFYVSGANLPCRTPPKLYRVRPSAISIRLGFRAWVSENQVRGLLSRWFVMIQMYTTYS